MTIHASGAAPTTAALALSLFTAGCTTHPPAAPAAAADPVTVTAVAATVADVGASLDAGGVLHARTTATIAARILAPVREVRVSPGDRVRRGQTLVVLAGDDLAAAAQGARFAASASAQESTAARAELEAAEAHLVLARTSHTRVANLRARGSATAQELDEATAALHGADARVAGAAARAAQAASAVEAAKAASQLAATTHTFAVLTAPFDGIVTEKLVEPGNLASPGLPLLRVEDTSEFRLEVRVDESRVNDVRLGDAVPVVLDASRTSLDGTVVEVSRAVDADARAFLVKIAVPGAPSLRSGAFGKARFAGLPRRGVTVPPAAIVRRGQITSVFVVDQGVARLRLVRLSGAEVAAGLSESEIVILTPPPDLTDGRRVRVNGGQ